MPVQLKEEKEKTHKATLHKSTTGGNVFFLRLYSADLVFSRQWKTLVHLLTAMHCVLRAL